MADWTIMFLGLAIGNCVGVWWQYVCTRGVLNRAWADE